MEKTTSFGVAFFDNLNSHFSYFSKTIKNWFISRSGSPKMCLFFALENKTNLKMSMAFKEIKRKMMEEEKEMMEILNDSLGRGDRYLV